MLVLTHREIDPTLFVRVFASQPDVAIGEVPRDVYPLGCEEDGGTCYMARPRDAGD